MMKKVKTAISISWVAVLMVALLSTAGCPGGDVAEAKKEAREAKTTVVKLQVQLAKTIEDYDALKAELNVVRQTRDELQKQVETVTQERDNALGLAEQAEQVITNLSDRATGQSNTQATLQKEIEELKALVAEQQALIEELQSATPTEPVPVDVPVDPNDVPQEGEAAQE